MSMQLCLFSQRWRERRESYRPAGEPINPRLYEVAELAGDREAKTFILAHHYSVSYPSARVRFRAIHARVSGRRRRFQPLMQRPSSHLRLSSEPFGQRRTGAVRVARQRAGEWGELVSDENVRVPAAQRLVRRCELQRPRAADKG